MQDKILNPFVSAVILAGGEGSRLWPLTRDKSKPSVTFAGRYKLIDIAISNAINAGIQDIFVTTQYQSSHLNSYLSKTFKKQHVEVLTPVQECHPHIYEGTADSVRKNILSIASHPAEYIFILSGDQIYHMDLIDMLDFAKDKNSDMVIASVPVPENDAKRMGLMKIDSSYKIKDFKEKPQTQQELAPFSCNEHKDFDFIGSMGIYLFKRQVLIDLLIDNPGVDFGKHLIPDFIKQGQAHAYVFNGYWEDVGTINSYYHANLKLMRSDGFNLFKAPVHSQIQMLPSPRIRDAQLKSSIVADGTIIEAKEITNSTIGMRIHIKEGTRILNSVLMGNDSFRKNGDKKLFTIGKNCLLDGVILDQDCQIGDNVTLTNHSGVQSRDCGPIYIRDKIIVIPAGTIIPDNYELAL
jgi:glucose-1-phosphate adenylyltransferase